MDDLYLRFGSLLRKTRQAASLSQATVAGRVGMSRTSIANIEVGRQHFPFHVLYKLADAVGADPAALLPKRVASRNVVPEQAVREFGLAADDTEWANAVVARVVDESQDGQTP